MEARDSIYCTLRSPLQPVPCAEPVKSSIQEGLSRNAPPHVPKCDYRIYQDQVMGPTATFNEDKGAPTGFK